MHENDFKERYDCHLNYNIRIIYRNNNNNDRVTNDLFSVRTSFTRIVRWAASKIYSSFEKFFLKKYTL